MASSRLLTLSDFALPCSLAGRELLLIAGASLLTAAAAQVAMPLPWTPVPITGQTLAVLLTGAVLGGRRAFLAQGLYLLEGACGMPVFAGGAAGAHVFLAPTAGYLVSFPFAAALVGWLAERRWDRSFPGMFLAMLLGSGVIFSFGLAWLSRFVTAPALLASGLLPFLPGDVIKATLSALAFPAAWRWVGRSE